MVRARKFGGESSRFHGELSFVVAYIAYERVLIEFGDGDPASPKVFVNPVGLWWYDSWKTGALHYPCS